MRYVLLEQIHNQNIFCTYHMAQNFGNRKLWRIVADKHSEQNIGGLVALHSEIARINNVGG